MRPGLQARPPLLPGDLARRRLEPELMDDPALPADELERALASLSIMHSIARPSAPIWKAIAPLVESAGSARVSVADFGCGRGDLLRALHRRAEGRIDCVGVDVNPRSLDLAAARGPVGARWVAADLLADPPPPALAELRVDVAVSTLFLHHLESRDVVRVLARMRACACRGVVVLDLPRTRWAWWTTVLGARLLSRSRVVHWDSGLSVRAAWRPEELLALAEKASLNAPKVRKIFPFWLQLLDMHDKY